MSTAAKVLAGGPGPRCIPVTPEGRWQMAVDAQDQMRLSITTSSDRSVEFVRILGDVDLSDSRQLGLAARRLIDTDAGTIYVDLGGTTFIGSTLVAFLVQIGKNGRKRRRLILCRPTPTASRVIHMTGLGKVAGVRPDLPPAWPDDAGEPDPEPTTGDPSERSESA